MELDDYGKQVWRNKYFHNIFIEKSYRWSNTLSMIDETISREIIMLVDLAHLDLSEWEPMTPEIYKKAKRKFREGYD